MEVIVAKAYTVALIGTGRIGFTLGFDKKREQPASHTMALKQNKRVKIIAGCDTDAARLEHWKKYCSNVPTYSNFGHLFAACNPEIVVIAVNENAHLKTALAAIRSKPRLIILEKPVALNMKEGLLIADEAKRMGVPVMINHERRFALDYNLAKSYMQKIGELQSINAELCSSLRVYCEKDEDSGAYSLLHDGTHLIDCINFFLSDSEKHDDKKSTLYDTMLTSVHLDAEDSSVVRNISAHFSSDKCNDITMRISGRSRFFDFGIDITGTEGRIKIGNGYLEFYKREESKLYTGFYSLAKDTSVKLPKQTCYFSNMLQSAVDFLDEKSPLGSTLQDGLNALDIIEQIKAAIKDNGNF
ncbi:MAG: Gfo/Idh/MocA family oxidoreductase [Treponema sp.]|nr:Gfo/Idh/MocA family oxidoreductase [Treponema sp.]